MSVVCTVAEVMVADWASLDSVVVSGQVPPGVTLHCTVWLLIGVRWKLSETCNNQII